MKNSQLQEILYRYANTKGVGLPLTAEEMLNAISSWLVDTLPECIDIVTSTLPAGSQATAELSGSGTPDDHYIIKVGIPQGATGPTGATGPQGPQGTKGEQGEQGVGYNYMGNWISQNEYHENDNVTYNGTTYVCIKAVNGSSVTPDTDTTHWHVFAAAATKDNFPLSAQNQLYAHYIAIYNSPSSGAKNNNIMCYFVNASSVEYDNLDTLKTGFVNRMLCNGKVMYVGKIHHANYLYKAGNNIYLDITDLSTGLSRSTDISTIDEYDSLTVDDTVVAFGVNDGANALVLYADKNGVILDSDSETVMVQKMMSMTEKGTDFNAIVSAMEANGYKVTK